MVERWPEIMGLNGKSVFFLQLEAISEMNPVDLRKQLRVEFKGEEGLDEGGLQKELFQLLIEQLLDPMYGECIAVCSMPFFLWST